MAINFTCSTVRLVNFTASMGSTSMVATVFYRFVIPDNRTGNLIDVLYNAQEEQLSRQLMYTSTSPTPQQIAQWIKADAQSKYGGSLQSVIINGTSY